MGFPPSVMDTMSLWEAQACREGWMKANGAEEEAEPPSWEEHLKMVGAAMERKG